MERCIADERKRPESILPTVKAHMRQKMSSHHNGHFSLQNASTSLAVVLLLIATLVSYIGRDGLFVQRTMPALEEKPQLNEPAFPFTNAPAPLAVNPLFIVATGAAGAVTTKQLMSLSLKPILIELGVVVVLQAVGIPLLGTAGTLLRRIRIVQIGRTLHVPAPILRQIARQGRLVSRASNHVWKAAGTVYSKTSLSKIVQRTKKLVKVFSHGNDEEEH